MQSFCLLTCWKNLVPECKFYQKGTDMENSITDKQLQKIAGRIYQNECQGKEEFLVHWNLGEEFMSLGIGHFIWYPKGQPRFFNEMFPQLLQFMRDSGTTLPDWIPEHAPWNSREEFLEHKHEKLAEKLKQFLLDTFDQQAAFMLWRCTRFTPEGRAGEKVRLLEASPAGIYCLIDYMNFKGRGDDQGERYNGYGWGLLQVLDEMPDDLTAEEAPRFFAAAAELVLRRRIDNSPPERSEIRWLPGWINRLGTYLPEFE